MRYYFILMAAVASVAFIEAKAAVDAIADQPPVINGMFFHLVPADQVETYSAETGYSPSQLKAFDMLLDKSLVQAEKHEQRSMSESEKAAASLAVWGGQ